MPFFYFKEFKAFQTHHNISPHCIPVEKVRIVIIIEKPCCHKNIKIDKLETIQRRFQGL